MPEAITLKNQKVNRGDNKLVNIFKACSEN